MKLIRQPLQFDNPAQGCRVVVFELNNPKNCGSRIYTNDIYSTTRQPDNPARIECQKMQNVQSRLEVTKSRLEVTLSKTLVLRKMRKTSKTMKKLLQMLKRPQNVLFHSWMSVRLYYSYFWFFSCIRSTCNAFLHILNHTTTVYHIIYIMK